MDSDPSLSPVPPNNRSEEERVIKRRTKTGCQTCRIRRIKCDEGKPECNNCIKSNRKCEGFFPIYLSYIKLSGYGVKSSKGDVLSGNPKKSQRFAPYGDKDTSGRSYKNIVPAPFRAGVEIQSPAHGPIGMSRKPRISKRKREDDGQSAEIMTSPGIINGRIG